MEDQLKRYRRRKEDLLKRIKENEEFMEHFDQNIGPFEKMYDTTLSQLDTLYEDAKKKHAAGVQQLIENFGYHPAYKRGEDDFFAVPFKPL